MNSRWIAHLDAHIATGQIAAEAESAETLSWLLKLEPEQRWYLVLSRDPRLKRLVAGDYRRLLILMVQLESAALADIAEPLALCTELERLNAGLTQGRNAVLQLAQERQSPSGYDAHAQAIESLRDQAEAALTQVRQGAWRAALHVLWEVTDPAYREWRERLARWLAARETVSELAHQTGAQDADRPDDSLRATLP
ncbi:hypothetical protein [uncultured Lamprocystis sp.]|jgi:hypothetical protein|uniref:hypothetical protein n=1 Tax=uncultured Lamprocystis sp. TaxID=543132 RepID=UPI0025E0222E|nr:hypothetical protein [uncultured Lamprocystis sp.]